MVYRVYVEKKEGLANEAAGLRNDARTLLGISSIENVRIISKFGVASMIGQTANTLFCRRKAARMMPA